MTVSRHDGPSALRHCGRNSRKDSGGGAIYQEKSLLRAKYSRRLLLRLPNQALRRMQIVKSVYFGNIQFRNPAKPVKGFRHIPFMPRHMKRIYLRCCVFS